MGPPGAKVVIIEFADFECPVCAGFVNGALRAVRSEYPNDIAIVFRHWPLEYHHLAYPARGLRSVQVRKAGLRHSISSFTPSKTLWA
jgi:protein-disulfide isomerase